MLQTLRNAWNIPELRKKIIFTLFILLIYRVGNVIPVPFIDVTTLGNYFDSVLSTTILGLYNAMSGSAFSRPARVPALRRVLCLGRKEKTEALKSRRSKKRQLKEKLN